jgi:hypothetical protein
MLEVVHFCSRLCCENETPAPPLTIYEAHQ